MAWLDEEGRLFGRVNVVDAAVILAVLALLAGGGVLVLSDADERTPEPAEPEPWRYATATYNASLDSQAAHLDQATSLTVRGETFNVTDVHRSLTRDGEAHIAVRIPYRGHFEPGGDRRLAGESVTVETNTSRIAVQLEAVALESGTFETRTSSLVLIENVSSVSARTLQAGDEITVGGDVVGTVTAVDAGPAERAAVGLELTTRTTAAGPTFGGRLLRVGQRIGVVTDEAIVRGQIAALGTSDPTAAG